MKLTFLVAGEPRFHRFASLVAVWGVSGALACSPAPAQGDEVGEEDSTDSSSTETQTDSESSDGEESESESESSESTDDDSTTGPPDDLPVDPCDEPEPGVLCLFDHGQLASGVPPTSLLVDEVTGDEFLDVIVVGISSSFVQVAPGQGNASFALWLPSNVAAGVRGAALGDIDDDGALDLVVANLFMPAGTGVAFGDGMGGFDAAGFLQTGSAPRALAIGSIDGDTWLDVAVADEEGSSVYVLLGNGFGGLQVIGSVATGAEPYDIVLADFDLDGDVDIATADRLGDSISILWGAGDGSFSDPLALAVGDGPRGLVATDLDADGDPDLASADFDGGTVSLVLNRTETLARTFDGAITHVVGAEPYAVAAGDINGDGLPEVVSADSAAGQVSVLASVAGQAHAAPLAFPTGLEPFDVALADIDDDGRLDILCANFGDGSVSLLTTGG